MLKGKQVLLATMHKKELAIKQSFEQSLGCEVILPQNYDTDQFGTFCGEKERHLIPSKMVIHKAKIAMEQFSYEFGIASEGSFGPHPLIPFLPLQEEWLGFIDATNKLEVVVKKQTNQTNYAMFEFERNQSFDDFLSRSGFPLHAMIVRELSSNLVIAKGIQTLSELESALEKAFKVSDRIRLETDMRAMFNPTRMQIIKELTLDLINRIQSVCMKCGIYGFGEIKVSGNLRCSCCSSETQLFKNIIEKCIRCDYQVIKPRPDMLYRADPSYCSYCNP
jgi:hypothetical protein